MRLYAAIDLHSNNNVLVIINGRDRIVCERRLPNMLSHILAELAPHRKSIEAVAVESTYNWYWLVDGLMDAGFTVKLVNTAAVKTYDGLKYSGDEHDARHLAHLLRLGVLPTGYIYPKEERAVRDLFRKRGQLVRCRTTQILSIQNLVSRNSGHGISTRDIRELDEKKVSEACDGNELRALAIRSNLALPAVNGGKTAAVARVTLENSGNITCTGKTRIDIFLSWDDTVADGILVRTVTPTFTLKPGASRVISIPLRKLPVVINRKYGLVALITHPGYDPSQVASGLIYVVAPPVS